MGLHCLHVWDPRQSCRWSGKLLIMAGGQRKPPHKTGSPPYPFELNLDGLDKDQLEELKDQLEDDKDRLENSYEDDKDFAEEQFEDRKSILEYKIDLIKARIDALKG